MVGKGVIRTTILKFLKLKFTRILQMIYNNTADFVENSCVKSVQNG